MLNGLGIFGYFSIFAPGNSILELNLTEDYTHKQTWLSAGKWDTSYPH